MTDCNILDSMLHIQLTCMTHDNILTCITHDNILTCMTHCNILSSIFLYRINNDLYRNI